MTEGGPANSTTVVALLLWQQTYVFLDSPQAGAAAATAVIMSAVLVVVCFPQLKPDAGEVGLMIRDHDAPVERAAVRRGDGARHCCGWSRSPPP